MVSATRRSVLQRALMIASATLTLPLAARAADSCGDPSTEPLRESLHYGTAPAPASSCSLCTFFTADKSGACGTCQIMGGPVDKGSHCDSWSAKS